MSVLDRKYIGMISLTYLNTQGTYRYDLTGKRDGERVYATTERENEHIITEATYVCYDAYSLTSELILQLSAAPTVALHNSTYSTRAAGLKSVYPAEHSWAISACSCLACKGTRANNVSCGHAAEMSGYILSQRQ